MNKFVMLALAILVSSPSVYAYQVSRLTPVIDGHFYRSGSVDRQPLSRSTLEDLCEQGYTLVVYVYKGASDQTVSCSRGTLHYLSKTSWQKPSGILSMADEAMEHGGKVLIHCWYGVHASNFVSAAALNRFCGYSGSQAANYFRNGVPAKSLPQSRINELAEDLVEMGTGSGSMDGCP